MAQIFSFNFGRRKPATPMFASNEEVKRAIKNELARRLSDDDLEIPPLPHVALRVLELARKPNSSIVEITELIETDPQITAKILKMANSPVYRGLHDVTNIDTAVVMLGLWAVADLIFAFSVQGKVFRSALFGEEMDRQWEHAVGCAYISMALAKGLKLPGEDVYVGGLLHDIGKPIMLNAVENVFRRNPQKVDPAVIEGPFLDELLEEYHGPFGGLVARRWELPEPLIHPIERHHYPDLGGDDRLTTIVAVADLFCHRFGIGCDANEELNVADHPWVHALGISHDDVVKVFASLEKDVFEYVEFFKQSA